MRECLSKFSRGNLAGKEPVNIFAESIKAVKGKSKENPRPSLAILSALNDKLSEESKTFALVQEINRLKLQNRDLSSANSELSKQLSIEKRLRKQWCKQDLPSFEDLDQLRSRLELMKKKYRGLV